MFSMLADLRVSEPTAERHIFHVRYNTTQTMIKLFLTIYFRFRDSFSAHFPDIEVKGCVFHYSKAIISKVSRNGFKGDYSNKKCASFSAFVRPPLLPTLAWRSSTRILRWRSGSIPEPSSFCLLITIIFIRSKYISPDKFVFYLLKDSELSNT